MLDNAWVRIANNWAHDFASGLWGACAVVVWMLGGRLAEMPAEAAVALTGVQRLMWWVLVASLAAIAATGGIRLGYWRAQTPAAEMSAKRPALVGKHVGYLVVYGLGTWWVWGLLG